MFMTRTILGFSFFVCLRTSYNVVSKSILQKLLSMILSKDSV